MTGAAGTHLAVLYRDTGDLLDQIAAATVEDHLVVLACGAEHDAALADLLRDRVALRIDRPDARSRPAAAAYHRLARRLDGDTAGLTVIAEPDPGDTPDAWHRVARFEAALDLTLPGRRITAVCAYPATTPAPVLGTAHRTHPAQLTEQGPQPNPGHADPATVLHAVAADRPPPPPVPPRLRITGSSAIADLGPIRRQVAAHLGDVATLVRTDFVAAVNELLANGYLHGVPPLELTLWVTPEIVECRVTDRGSGWLDPAAGYQLRPTVRRAGAGLWLARQACDDIDMWRTGDALTVRAVTANTSARPYPHSGAIARAETARSRVASARRTIDRRPTPQV